MNVTAALALKQIMMKYKIAGTIRVYPGIAEELLASRTPLHHNTSHKHSQHNARRNAVR